MGRDEDWNQSLEHSKRYEVGSELILFLRRSRSLGLGYFVFFPHQAVYEVPVESRDEANVIDEYEFLKPLDEFQLEPLEAPEGYIIVEYGGNFGPFDINLYMLREIAIKNNLKNHYKMLSQNSNFCLSFCGTTLICESEYDSLGLIDLYSLNQRCFMIKLAKQIKRTVVK